MQYYPLVDRNEIAEAFHSYKHNIRQGAQAKELPVGWHGGGGTFPAYWHPAVEIWTIFKEENDRYWCCYGLGDPSIASNLSIVCEINPPIAGTNRRMGGVFVRDGHGRVFLTHSGKVAGGRPGIGKEAFLAFYKDADLQTVSWPDGQTSQVILVARIDDKNITEQVAAYIRIVDAFKKATTGK